MYDDELHRYIDQHVPAERVPTLCDLLAIAQRYQEEEATVAIHTKRFNVLKTGRKGLLEHSDADVDDEVRQEKAKVGLRVETCTAQPKENADDLQGFMTMMKEWMAQVEKMVKPKTSGYQGGYQGQNRHPNNNNYNANWNGFNRNRNFRARPFQGPRQPFNAPKNANAPSTTDSSVYPPNGRYVADRNKPATNDAQA